MTRVGAEPGPARKLPVVGAGSAGPAQARGGASSATRDPAWLVVLRVGAALGFAAAIPVVLAVPAGMRLFWTVAIAALPLVFVLGGFHLWRRVCPLALVGQLGRLVGRPGTRKAGKWLSANYLYVQLGVLVFGLACRLVATNGSPWALAAFLGAAALAAAVTSFVYTGKTWCNYVCPVGIVEKIYTEPVGRATPVSADAQVTSSQCTPCTACKKSCPDIDLEQGYWKEAAQTPRRVSYYAWPGVVLGFYGYYYLVSGGWDYYFSGAWTREPEQWRDALAAGFTFAPAVPRLVAAPLTLVCAGAASFALWALVERVLASRLPAERARHVTLALAGCAAFLLFYLFAGQPTLAKAPWWLRRAAEALVVAAGALLLARRLLRSESKYVNEKFARGILKRWEWGDTPPSADLSDVYLIHTERTKQREAAVRSYKLTIRDLVADGVLTRVELSLVTSLRRQLGIGDKEHEQALSELTAEEKRLFDPAYRGSVEQRLSREQYRRDLERIVVQAARERVAPDPAALARVRQEFAVGQDEHEAALRELRAPDGPIAARAREEWREIEVLRRAVREARAAGGGEGSRSVAFFARLAGWREQARRAAAAAYAALVPGLAPPADAAGDDRAGDDRADDDRAGDATALVACTTDPYPHLRAAAAYVLSRFDDDAARAALRAAAGDEHPLVREAAVRGLGARGRLTQELVQRALDDPDERVKRAVLRAVAGRPRDGGGGADPAALAQTTHGIGSSDPAQFATLDKRAAVDSLSTIEKMMFLAEVPLFASLGPDDLDELTGIAGERHYPARADLCRAGERGDEVFVIVQGRVQAHVGGSGGAGSGGPPRVLGESGAGACIGEMAALDAGPRSATVTALEDTRVLVLPGDDFRQLLADRPAIALKVLAVVTGRLRKMIERETGGS